MPTTGQKVCGGGVVGGWLRPILVFSLAQAEQNEDKICVLVNLDIDSFCMELYLHP